MNPLNKATLIVVACLMVLFLPTNAYPQPATLDRFENLEGWSYIQSDGVFINAQLDKGLSGKSVRIDYDFIKGTGYCGIQKRFPIELPENFEISFYIKAESPANNFEIKFLDSTGNNVWWVNNRNYEFPSQWQKISIKPRHINFAWGPTEDKHFKRFDRIEFTIASFVGGSGKIWIDSLTFKTLPPIPKDLPSPVVYEVAKGRSKPIELFSQQNKNYWNSTDLKNQKILIDFKTNREIGGIKINWMEDRLPKSFDIYASDDSLKWEKVISVNSNHNSTSFIRLPEFETRYIVIHPNESHWAKKVGIKNIELIEVEESTTPNNFFRFVAQNSPKGQYPRYLLDQASYWTITGVNGDTKEALINEDGMVEIERAKFSIEPVLRFGNKVLNWSNVNTYQSLSFSIDGKNYKFIPTVMWDIDDIDFQIGVASYGKANTSSKLAISYNLKNKSKKNQTLELYLLIRPFQVNPHYQFLNLPGGVGKIHKIESNTTRNKLKIDSHALYFSQPYETFYANSFLNANIYEAISNNFKSDSSATDHLGLNSGYVKYTITLKAGQTKSIFVISPYHTDQVDISELNPSNLIDTIAQVSEYWQKQTGKVKFNLPNSANHLIETYRANLMYILQNRDHYGIQPGSRSYERSWIRDGALTSSALLKSGIANEVKEFIEWYARHLYENGKVPCVVDFRGPDPVNEHDSHGQLIYLIHEYFSFTHDTAFLKKMNPIVLNTVNYIETLIAERSTDYFKYGNDSLKAFYGLVPESISHEGYSAQPMHSYWDNFFILKGLKDASHIQLILGNINEYHRISQLTNTFRENLYNSLRLTIKNHNITYIPGCAELGDFDATSTTIALSPCNEMENLPKPEIYNTFNKYYDYFVQRKNGSITWVNFTPYENRIIGSFILLNQPEKAHELIIYFLSQQRPQGWHHWAEVVWNNYREPGFIGDMPHTWVGSDFINSFRSIFVHEDADHKTLCIGAGLKKEWIENPKGISIENLPTYYGTLSYTVKKDSNYYEIELSGDIKVPGNGICIKNHYAIQAPKKVTVNGVEINSFDEKQIVVNTFPCKVKVYF